MCCDCHLIGKIVSTHSRAEAAAIFMIEVLKKLYGFNTQPRGGGCIKPFLGLYFFVKFQHTAARRRLLHSKSLITTKALVSTHSRAEAAA